MASTGAPAHPLDRLAGGQAVVQAVAQERRAEAEDEARQQAEQGVLDRLGRAGRGRRRAGVTSSRPVLAAAPATWSWASWPLSTACWLDSADSCATSTRRELP